MNINKIKINLYFEIDCKFRPRIINIIKGVWTSNSVKRFAGFILETFKTREGSLVIMCGRCITDVADNDNESTV